ncbi:MAG: HAMP domain-containing methyl-accepting chemotaxis protein [Desulfobacteraceae bacterium]|jgi:methyl-accepting chemotaxis protein
MKIKLSIGLKIWLSLSILVLGYFATMAVGFILGQRNEISLLSVSESLFPASMSGQNALAAFREEIKLYNDAVLMGDTEVLENARNKSAELNEVLSMITALEGISTDRKEEIKKILKQYKSFHTSAQDIYLRMANGDSNDNITQTALKLGKETPLIEDDLTNLKSTMAQDLKKALHNISDSTRRLRYINLFVFFGVLLFATLVISIITRRFISKPINDTVLMIKDMAEGGGDLTLRLQIKSNDEIGDLVRWFNLFLEKLQTMIRNIVRNAETLNQASTELSGLSGQMSAGADQMSLKAKSVATASEQMSVNMDSVAAAMEEASTNIGIVANSTEEMTSTINEIAQNSEKARTITGESVDKAHRVSIQIDELGKAAQEIGKVTETISEISEQTNLLALNATIESARAGEAGKGFAVVANEIKDLAKQTAEATQQIKGQIEGIQKSTTGTVTEIEEILKVINDVNEIVATIATAVEEQSVTTNEIAGNVSQASQGIQEVNENVSESTVVSRDIAREVTDCTQSSAEISNSSAQVSLSADQLRSLAEELNDMVNKFKV